MEQNEMPLSLIAGANLKRFIKQSKYKTQDVFAFEFGIDERTLRRWLRNGIDSLSTLEQIAEFLMIDVFQLLAR